MIGRAEVWAGFAVRGVLEVLMRRGEAGSGLEPAAARVGHLG